jgi:hypothetical protein
VGAVTAGEIDVAETAAGAGAAGNDPMACEATGATGTAGCTTVTFVADVVDETTIWLTGWA